MASYDEISSRAAKAAMTNLKLRAVARGEGAPAAAGVRQGRAGKAKETAHEKARKSDEDTTKAFTDPDL
jgi:hypothetical protein